MMLAFTSLGELVLMMEQVLMILPSTLEVVSTKFG